MTNIQVNKTLKDYNFNYDGIADINNICYSVKNGPGQLHLIRFNKKNQVIIHKITNDSGNVYVNNKYKSINELVDYLNNCSGGIKF